MYRFSIYDMYRFSNMYRFSILLHFARDSSSTRSMICEKVDYETAVCKNGHIALRIFRKKKEAERLHSGSNAMNNDLECGRHS